MHRRVLITGATGYLGRPLAEELGRRGHDVAALVRPGSQVRAPKGVRVLNGDALDMRSVAAALRGCDTLVHLVGTPHPAPWKTQLFESVDEPALKASLEASTYTTRPHLVYVSVAQPAPVMRAFVRVRQRCEAAIYASGLRATILRPWYVLGPGHRWPVLLTPAYRVAEWLPLTRDGARRLALLQHAEMIGALAWSVEHPAEGTRILGVQEIRSIAATATAERFLSRRPGAIAL